MKYLFTQEQFDKLTKTIFEQVDDYDDLINKANLVGTKSQELDNLRKKQELEKQKNLTSNNTTTTTTTIPQQETTNVAPTLETAKEQIGIQYKWGGSKPTTGFDCSGLVTYVTGLPRQSAQGFFTNSNLKKVSKENLKPGDLVFFGNGGKAHHAGIVDSVDEQGNLKSMIHARGGQDCPGNKTTNGGKNCVVEKTTNISWYTPILGYKRATET